MDLKAVELAVLLEGLEALEREHANSHPRDIKATLTHSKVLQPLRKILYLEMLKKSSPPDSDFFEKMSQIEPKDIDIHAMSYLSPLTWAYFDYERTAFTPEEIELIELQRKAGNRQRYAEDEQFAKDVIEGMEREE